MKNSKPCSLLLVCLLLLPACTGTKQIAQTTPVNYYPACYQPISTLRDAESGAAKSAVVGGAGGALIGALIGGLVSGRLSGALIGAGAGAVAGASVGYAKGKQDAIRDVKSRYISYVGDIKAELNSLDATNMAARSAQACYEKSFNALVAQYKAKAISKEEYRLRFNEIREGLRETAAYLGQVDAKTSEKEQQFRAALEEESATAGKPVPQPRRVSASKSVAKAAAPKKATGAPVPASPQPELTQPLAGLDESTLDAMSEGAAEYGEARKGTQIQKVAIEEQLLKMDNVDASLSAI